MGLVRAQQLWAVHATPPGGSAVGPTVSATEVFKVVEVALSKFSVGACTVDLFATFAGVDRSLQRLSVGTSAGTDFHIREFVLVEGWQLKATIVAAAACDLLVSGYRMTLP